MWELIRENNLKSWILFILMGAALIVMGYAIGSVWFGPEGALYGVFISCMVWLIMSLVSFTSGDTLVLKMSGAKEVTPDIHPQLFNIVEEMKIAANLPVMPRIYIIDVAYPNAFATGISANKSSIAVTAGLLTMLNRDELQGVIAHEMSHITNRDVLFVTFAGVMLGSIALLSEVFFRSMFYSSRGSSRRYRSGGGSGQGGAILAVIAIVFAILAPILTRLLYFALSRRREYLADATAVRLTRYPEGLASALEKISSNMGQEEGRPNKVIAPMYIVNPLLFKGTDERVNLFSTHPPTSLRIKVLRNISGGAGYGNYAEAFKRASGKDIPIPASGLRMGDNPVLREGGVQEKTKNAKDKARELGDLLKTLNGFAFYTCACGLKIKVPAGLKKGTIRCPRCGKGLDLSAAGARP